MGLPGTAAVDASETLDGGLYEAAGTTGPPGSPFRCHLCCTGNAYGIGAARVEELHAACAVLKVRQQQHVMIEMPLERGSSARRCPAATALSLSLSLPDYSQFASESNLAWM